MGIFLVGLSFILKHLVGQIPDFIIGLLLGTGVGLELLGIYAMRHDLSKFRNFKKRMFNRLIGRSV